MFQFLASSCLWHLNKTRVISGLYVYPCHSQYANCLDYGAKDYCLVAVLLDVWWDIREYFVNYVS